MPSRVAAIHPLWAIEGGRITVTGTDFPTDRSRLPEVRIGEAPARVVYASPVAISAIVPPGLEGGPTTVRIEGVAGETGFIDVAAPFATGLHQVDNPVFDRDGNLYVTYSGTRGEQVPVSIFRVRPNGTLFVGDRSGTIFRVDAQGHTKAFAAVPASVAAFHLAIGPDAALYVTAPT